MAHVFPGSRVATLCLRAPQTSRILTFSRTAQQHLSDAMLLTQGGSQSHQIMLLSFRGIPDFTTLSFQQLLHPTKNQCVTGMTVLLSSLNLRWRKLSSAQ